MAATKSRLSDNTGRGGASGVSKEKSANAFAGMTAADPKRERPSTEVNVEFRGAVIERYKLTHKASSFRDFMKVVREAVAQSRSNAPVNSLRVDFGPQGVLVTEVKDSGAAIQAASVEADAELEPELANALEAARERGRLRAAEVLGGKEMVTAEELAELLGTTRVTVNSKRASGQLLGLDGIKRGFKFPTWQLNRDGKPFPALADLHRVLGGPWAVYRFLVQPIGALDGTTGREVMEAGRVDDLLEAAESVGRDFG